MFQFVYFLPVPLAWADFLCKLNSHLQRIAPISHRGRSQGAGQRRNVWVRHTEYLGVPVDQLGVHRLGVPSTSLAGFLFESMK